MPQELTLAQRREWYFPGLAQCVDVGTVDATIVAFARAVDPWLPGHSPRYVSGNSLYGEVCAVGGSLRSLLQLLN